MAAKFCPKQRATNESSSNSAQVTEHYRRHCYIQRMSLDDLIACSSTNCPRIEFLDLLLAGHKSEICLAHADVCRVSELKLDGRPDGCP